MPEQCAVCLQDLGSKNVMTTDCGHTFCASCIIKNLHHSNKCPMCRTVIDTNSGHNGSGNSHSITYDEVEEQANILISAMSSDQRLGRAVFEAYPGCDWDTLPDNITEAMTNIIRREILSFVGDLHLFTHPDDNQNDNANLNIIKSTT